MTNVNGNWKGGKSVVKYSRTRALKAKGTQAAGQIARSYKRYVKPSTNLLKGAGKIALGASATAPIPTLARVDAFFHFLPN